MAKTATKAAPKKPAKVIQIKTAKTVNDGRFKPTNVSLYTFEVNRLIDEGRKVPVGAIWTYEEMSVALEREVTRHFLHLNVALRRLARDHGIEFTNVRGEGYKRLESVGIVGEFKKDRQSIKTKINRSNLRASNVDYGALPDAKKAEHDTHRAVLGALTLCTSRKVIGRLHQEAKQVSGQIDPEKVLKLFKG